MKPQIRQHNTLVQDVGDELVVYDQERHQAHRLNRTSALIFRHCDGQHTLAELAAIVGKEMKLRSAEDVVRLGLDRLRQAHLLESSESAKRATSISRRDLLAKLKYAGVFGMALPAITSIATPAPVAAFFAPPPPPPSSTTPTGKIYKPRDNPNQPAPPLPAAGDTIEEFTVCNGTCTNAPSLTGTVIMCSGAKCDGAECGCHLFQADASATGTWKRVRNTAPVNPQPTDSTFYDPTKVYACICVKPT